MTKREISELIKRYPNIREAIKKGLHKATFYVGKRKREIVLTDDVKAVLTIIDDIYNSTNNKWVRSMIRELEAGKSDISIICGMPWSRSVYYEHKRRLIEKIYNCCVSLQLIGYTEILKEEIAL